MKPILTEDDLKLEIQGARCKEALRIVGVPEAELAKHAAGPILFQWAHMAVFLEVEWRTALNWCKEHKGEILNYAKVMSEQSNSTAAKTDRRLDVSDVEPSDKARPT